MKKSKNLLNRALQNIGNCMVAALMALPITSALAAHTVQLVHEGTTLRIEHISWVSDAQLNAQRWHDSESGAKQRLRVFHHSGKVTEIAVEFLTRFPSGTRAARVTVENLAPGDQLELLDLFGWDVTPGRDSSDLDVTPRRDSSDLDVTPRRDSGLVTASTAVSNTDLLPVSLRQEIVQSQLVQARQAALADSSSANSINQRVLMHAEQTERAFAAAHVLMQSSLEQGQKQLDALLLSTRGIGGQCGHVRVPDVLMLTQSNPSVPSSTALKNSPKSPQLNVPGRFVNAGGQAIGNIGFYLYSATDGSYLGQFSVAANGSFSLGANIGDQLQLRPYGVAPPLTQLADIRVTVPVSADLGDVVIPDGATLTVRAIAADGLPITSGFIGINWYNLTSGWSTFGGTNNGVGQMGSQFVPPQQWEISLRPQIANLVNVKRYLGVVAADQTVDIIVPTGFVVSGLVTTSDGSAVPSANMSLLCESTTSAAGSQYFARPTIAADGSFSFNALAGIDWLCSISVPSPYFRPTLPTRRFVAGDRLDFTLVRGNLANINVYQPGGALYANGYNATVVDTDGIEVASCYGTPCNLLGSASLPSYLAFDLNSMAFLPPAMRGPQVLVNGVSAVVLSNRYFLRGAITPAGSVRVRAYDPASGKLVSSIAGFSNYQLPLRPGNYRIEYDFNTDYVDAANNMYRVPIVETRTIGADVVRDVALPALPALTLQLQGPCLDSYQVFVQVKTGGILVQRSGVPGAVSILGGGQCRMNLAPRLELGKYELDVDVVGWGLRTITVALTGPQTISVNYNLANAPRVWTGQLREANGTPVPNAAIYSYNDWLGYAGSTSTDTAGNFKIPVPVNGLVEFSAPALGNSVRKIVRNPDLNKAPSAVYLDAITFNSGTFGSLQRLYGNDDVQRRFNIVFVAESYTIANETYTDSNGNGNWDGIVWYDLNQSGLYDDADYLQRYGNAGAPQIGVNPTLNNEPFTDSNGDGALNQNEQALFRTNAQAFMRSLLGSDVWDRNRDAFNAYLLFVPSQQSGYDVVSASGQTLLSRNTAFGSRLNQARYTLELANYNAPREAALAALPQTDILVTMINQPIAGGRANSSILMQGGIHASNPNDVVGSHEFGHAIGGLADEYVEFSGVLNEWPLSYSKNVTRTLERALIPWRNDLPSDVTFPSTFAGASGVFEGASYVSGGAYRPAMNSTMRYNSVLFNAISAREIQRKLNTRLVDVADSIFGSGFE